MLGEITEDSRISGNHVRRNNRRQSHFGKPCQVTWLIDGDKNIWFCSSGRGWDPLVNFSGLRTTLRKSRWSTNPARIFHLSSSESVVGYLRTGIRSSRTFENMSSCSRSCNAHFLANPNTFVVQATNKSYWNVIIVYYSISLNKMSNFKYFRSGRKSHFNFKQFRH